MPTHGAVVKIAEVPEQTLRHAIDCAEWVRSWHSLSCWCTGSKAASTAREYSIPVLLASQYYSHPAIRVSARVALVFYGASRGCLADRSCKSTTVVLLLASCSCGQLDARHSLGSKGLSRMCPASRSMNWLDSRNKPTQAMRSWGFTDAVRSTEDE